VAKAEAKSPLNAKGLSMTRSTPITLLGAAALPLVALAVAGCGGGGGAATAKTPTPKTTAASPPKTTVARAAAVRVARTGLGKILVDSQGRTLYLFKKDSGMKSACTGACAAAWPPLRATGKPTVGAGAKASLVGTISRSDGHPQVTYNGHPLYTFVMDTKPGDTKGEGLTAFGAAWFAVSPARKQVSSKSASSSGGSGAAAPAAPKQPAPAAAPPAPKKPAPAPAPKKPASSHNGIPQNNGGDHDSDNRGGPDDGDGGI
jgi:predicted lipoprotein with Yx(FWY)xxD motif